MNKLTRYLVLSALLLLVGMTGCKKDSSADKWLSEAATSASMTLPSKINDNMTIVKIGYADKILSYVSEVDSLTFTRINADSLKKTTLVNLRNGMNGEMLEKIQNAKASVRYVYVNGTDTVMFQFAPEELSK